MREGPAPPRPQRPRKPRKSPVKKPKPEAPPIVPEPEPVIIPGRLTMLQLDRKTCHWPSGTRAPYTFCGEPVVGDRPYCQKHCRVSYQKPEKTWT